jgi:S-adenosylmethionine:tRNA ribosyltransferase-isomerase
MSSVSRLSDYDYELPESLIAQSPLDDRAASRLLWLHRKTGKIEHLRFTDVLGLLRAGDVLVMNDTRVTARRLLGRKPTGAEVEALLLAELGDGRFRALCRPGKRLQPGAQIHFEGDLRANVEAIEGETRVLRFENDDWPIRLAKHGRVPLPPYIHETLADPERYQTVYAASGGSAAAPTAGLHFTKDILSSLKEAGVRIAFVTLDVSLDTFKPVAVEDLGDHRMHGELAKVSAETAEVINHGQGRVIAIGTTAVRTLETFAANGLVQPGEESTKLFIRPGYAFKIVDGMFTNFHLPKTTMLMMISALAGHQHVFRAYGEAVKERYRFLSFGDSMLIL